MCGGTKTWRRLYKRKLPGFPRDAREKGQCRTLPCCHCGGDTVTRCACLKGHQCGCLVSHPKSIQPISCPGCAHQQKYWEYWQYLLAIKEQAQHTLPATCSFHAPSQRLAFSCCLKSHVGPFLHIGLITAGAHQQSGIPEDPAQSYLALQCHYLPGSACFRF